MDAIIGHKNEVNWTWKPLIVERCKMEQRKMQNEPVLHFKQISSKVNIIVDWVAKDIRKKMSLD